jgi:TRAP-type C4-dicarboxylate transport system permease small subunit
LEEFHEGVEMTQDVREEIAPDKRDLSSFHPVIVWICRTMTAIGAVILAIMMFLSVADICSRFFFNKPITGTYEIVSLMVVVVGCLGLGYCQLVKGNIMIDIVTKRLSPRGQAMMNIFSYLISISMCAIVTWQVSLRMWDYLFKQLGGKTVTLGIIFWPFMGLMALCFAWVTAIFCLDLYRSVREVIKR